jgi:hypothetical protein
MFGACLSLYIFLIYFVIFQSNSSCQVVFLKFDITHVMFYCTLYMTLNYFKSFFLIIEEMKCKIWDISFVKYLKMWQLFWN